MSISSNPNNRVCIPTEGSPESIGYSGIGRMTDSNGVIKEGRFEYGRLVEGKITVPGGIWLWGTFEGMGEQIASNGMKCIGRFENKRIVEGIKSWPDGDWLEGIFDEEGCTGKGRQTNSIGIIAEGILKKGKLVDGRVISPDGRVKIWKEIN